MTSPSGTVTSAALRAGETIMRHVRSTVAQSATRPAGGSAPASGWLSVTVLREPSDIDATQLPAPLAELGDEIDVRVRAAAGRKGTELAARLRDRGSGSEPSSLSGSDPQSALRSGLRRAKQLIEVGEVLAVDPAPHGKRSATPGGALLESLTKAAPKAGVR